MATHVGAITWDRSGGPSGYRSYGRKREEFAADFVLIARRTLRLADWRVFSCHFLHGADWRLCCQLLGLTKGDFYHALYGVTVALGRLYAEVEPYALFPISGYFSGVVRGRAIAPAA